MGKEASKQLKHEAARSLALKTFRSHSTQQGDDSHVSGLMIRDASTLSTQPMLLLYQSEALLSKQLAAVLRES